MATWPTTLPRPLVAGYAIAPVDANVRTDMEAGTPRVRRRSAARNDQVSVFWRFTDAQMAAFRTWFDGDCANGASWFAVDLNTGDAGLRSVQARFVGPWQSEMQPGPRWQVSAKLEVR